MPAATWRDRVLLAYVNTVLILALLPVMLLLLALAVARRIDTWLEQP